MDCWDCDCDCCCAGAAVGSVPLVGGAGEALGSAMMAASLQVRLVEVRGHVIFRMG